MPSGLYTMGAEAFMEGRINLLLDAIKVVLVDEDRYTPYLNADQYLDSVPEAAQISDPVGLTGRSLSDGAFHADDVVFAGVSGGDNAELVVIYKESFSRATSRLIAIFDSYPVVEADGGNVTVVWPTGGILSV